MATNRDRMIQSWRTNSMAWANAVQNRQIESRRLVTDSAILTEIYGSPELIDRAKALGGEFYVSSYEEMPNLGRFDAIVCNFSLLDDELDIAIEQMAMRLNAQGALAIQTVHPDAIVDNESDGWRIENFAGFGTDFTAPMPWYFRRRSSWLELLDRNGFIVETIIEPVHPVTAKPSSLLLICKLENPIF